MQVSADFLCFLLPPRRVRFRGRFEPTPKRRRRTVRSVVRGAEGQDSSWSIISRLILVTRNHVSISACTATGQLAPKPQPGWSRLRCFISFRLDIAVFVVIVTPWNPRTTAVEARSPVSSFLLSHNFLCL